MPTWRVADVSMQRSHAITIVMEETADDGKKYLYSVTKEPGATSQDFMVDFRKQVLRARNLRARADAIKAKINVNQIEAFLYQ